MSIPHTPTEKLSFIGGKNDGVAVARLTSQPRKSACLGRHGNVARNDEGASRGANPRVDAFLEVGPDAGGALPRCLGSVGLSAGPKNLAAKRSLHCWRVALVHEDIVPQHHFRVDLPCSGVHAVSRLALDFPS